MRSVGNLGHQQRAKCKSFTEFLDVKAELLIELYSIDKAAKDAMILEMLQFILTLMNLKEFHLILHK